MMITIQLSGAQRLFDYPVHCLYPSPVALLANLPEFNYIFVIVPF